MGNSSPPPLTPPTRGGKTVPPPRWGRPGGGGAELLRKLLAPIVHLKLKGYAFLLVFFVDIDSRHTFTYTASNLIRNGV